MTPPIWKFRHHQFPLDFQYLVSFIRYFLSFSIFYMTVWIFRNREKPIRELSYTFTFYNSLFCCILSVYYFFTTNRTAAIMSLASICSYMLADVYYGALHYHSLMCSLNGYAHHIVYFIVALYTLYYDWMNAAGIFLLSEIPTMILNIKYFFQQSGFTMDVSIFMGFLLFRVLGWGFIIQQNMDIGLEYKFTLSIAGLALLLHIYWTFIHGKKIWRKYLQ